jgi:hypothetical protein
MTMGKLLSFRYLTHITIFPILIFDEYMSQCSVKMSWKLRPFTVIIDVTKHSIKCVRGWDANY